MSVYAADYRLRPQRATGERRSLRDALPATLRRRGASLRPPVGNTGRDASRRPPPPVHAGQVADAACDDRCQDFGAFCNSASQPRSPPAASTPPAASSPPATSRQRRGQAERQTFDDDAGDDDRAGRLAAHRPAGAAGRRAGRRRDAGRTIAADRRLLGPLLGGGRLLSRHARNRTNCSGCGRACANVGPAWQQAEVGTGRADRHVAAGGGRVAISVGRV